MLRVILLLILTAPVAKAQKSVLDAAARSKEHTLFVNFAKAAGLNEMLLFGAGPFTVFAPTNQAFNKLASSEREDLLKPEAKSRLTKLMLYHIIAGNLDMTALTKAATDGKGKTVIRTMNGETLLITLKGTQVLLTDDQGATVMVSGVDLKAKNGIIHPIDKVLSP